MRGIPIPFEQVPKTSTSLGRFEKASGGGYRGDASALVQSAGNMTAINARGFVVAAASVGAIGEAVANEGHALTQLKIKQNEAIAIRKEQEAVLSMDLEQANISADLAKEPDETKWAGIVEKRSKALSGQLLTGDLSPVARQAISQRLTDWNRRQDTAVTINSAKRSFDKVGEAGKAEIIRAIGDKDPVKALEVGANLRDAGYISEDELARLEVQGKELAQRNEVDEAYGFAISNPDEFLKDPEKYAGHLEAQQRDSLETQARQAQRQNLGDSANAFTDELYGGKFATLKDMQAAFPESFGAKIRSDFEQDFIRMAEPGRLAQKEQDAPMNFARLTDEIEKYDPAKDKDGERFIRLNQDVKRSLSQSDPRGALLNSLSKKYYGTGGLEPSEPLKQSILDISRTMLDAGAFGNFKVVVPSQPGLYGTQAAPKIEEDLNAKAAAQGKRGSALLFMSKWAAANPDADPAKVHSVFRDFLAGNAPPIRSTVSTTPQPAAPRAGQTEFAPWEEELPDSPGGDLIPFLLPPR